MCVIERETEGRLRARVCERDCKALFFKCLYIQKLIDIVFRVLKITRSDKSVVSFRNSIGSVHLRGREEDLTIGIRAVYTRIYR